MGAYSNTPRGNGLLAVSILLLIPVSIIVPARLFVRARVIRSFGADDWATLFASVRSTPLFEVLFVCL